MRLILIQDKVTPLGGSEHSVRVQISGLIEREHSLLVATSPDQVRLGTDDPELRGVEWLAMRAGHGFRSARAAARIICEAAWTFDPDLVEIGNVYGLLGPTGVKYLEKHFRVVHTCRDTRPTCPHFDRLLPGGEICREHPGPACLRRHCLGPEIRPRVLREILEFSLRFRALRQARAVLVESTAFRNLLLELGVPGEKIHILPLYVKSTGDTPDPPSRSAPYILATGLLEKPEKGLEYLIRAFSEIRHSDARLRLTGRRGEAWDRVLPLIREKNLDDRIDITGWLSETALAGELGRCRVAAFPSRLYESFGLAGAEAAAAGRPVVASNCGGSRDWIRDGETGAIADRRYPEAMAAALNRYIDDPELADIHGSAARAFVTGRYTREANLDSTMEVYDRVMEQ